MAKVNHWFLKVAVACLVCGTAIGGEPSKDQGDQSQSDREVISWRERYLMLGRDTYNEVCASCHEEGKDGAPAIGVRESWSDRSPLWTAVLFEHAKSGYLGMPAKGGHPELSDRAVESAGEYMLSVTFPELPKD